MKLAQIAFSVVDLDTTLKFYQHSLGMIRTGVTKLTRGKQASKIQGLDNVASTCGWMVDPEKLIQLEFFQFERPLGRKRPADWSPCDIGYTGIAVIVRNLSETLKKLEHLNSKPLKPSAYINGRECACVIDPNGVLLELMEARPNEIPNNIPSRILGVTLSTPSLEASRKFFIESLGAKELEHAMPGRESLWGLQGVNKNTMLIDGNPGWIEVNEYLDPSPQPLPPDHRISDFGIANFGFRVANKEDYDLTYQTIIDKGYSSNAEPAVFPGSKVVYLNDGQGLSIELFYSANWLDSVVGRSPPSLIIKAIYWFLGKVVTKLDNAAYQKYLQAAMKEPS